MKKLFSLTVAFLVLLTLTACVSRSEEEPKAQFTIEIHGEETLTGQFAFDANQEQLLFDTLTEHFDVEYTQFDFGIMLSSIDTLTTPYGSFIQILHNGEFAQVGVSDLKVEEDDVITFERAWFDVTAQRIYEAIHGFMKHHQASYANEETQHPYVYAALALLDETALPKVDASSSGSSGERINTILAARAIDQNVDALQSIVYEEKTIAWPYATGLSILALLDYDASLETFVTLFIEDLNDRELHTIDIDTLAIALLTLEAIDETFPHDVTALKTTIIDAIQTGLYTSSYGDNAATFAHAIIALIAVGEDPRDGLYEDDDGKHLVDRFLTFESANGAFYYHVDDEHPDLLFSTPQAFLALVTLHVYFNTGQPVHPFMFD